MGAITVLVVAAFAIDRLVAGLFFLLSFSPDLRPLVSADVSGSGHDRTRRLLYAIVAGYLGVVVVAGILKVRVFEVLTATGTGGARPNAFLDTVVTGMVLAAGADRLSELVKSFSGEKKGHEDKPIQITGTLTLEHGAGALRAETAPRP